MMKVFSSWLPEFQAGLAVLKMLGMCVVGGSEVTDAGQKCAGRFMGSTNLKAGGHMLSVLHTMRWWRTLNGSVKMTP